MIIQPQQLLAKFFCPQLMKRIRGNINQGWFSPTFLCLMRNIPCHLILVYALNLLCQQNLRNFDHSNMNDKDKMVYPVQLCIFVSWMLTRILWVYSLLSHLFGVQKGTWDAKYICNKHCHLFILHCHFYLQQCHLFLWHWYLITTTATYLSGNVTWYLALLFNNCHLFIWHCSSISNTDTSLSSIAI